MVRRRLVNGQAAYSTGEVWKRGCHGVKNYGVKVVIVRMKVRGGLCSAVRVAALDTILHSSTIPWLPGGEAHKRTS